MSDPMSLGGLVKSRVLVSPTTTVTTTVGRDALLAANYSSKLTINSMKLATGSDRTLDTSVSGVVGELVTLTPVMLELPDSNEVGFYAIVGDTLVGEVIGEVGIFDASGALIAIGKLNLSVPEVMVDVEYVIEIRVYQYQPLSITT